MTRVYSRVARLAVGASLAIALALAVACGSSDSESGAKPGGSGGQGAVDATGAVTVVAKDNSYEPKDVTGPGGSRIALKLENKGAAIHNFVIKDQKAADGKEIQTGLLPANQSETLEFTLPAGTYDFYCSVHPVEMRGKLTLS